MKSQRCFNPFVRSSASGIVAAVVIAFSANPATAAVATWLNTGTDFNAGASWTGGSGTGGVPGTADIATFTNARVTDANLSAPITVQGLSFSTTGTSGYTISGSAGQALTLTNTGTGASGAINALNTSGTNTVSAPILLGGAAATTAWFGVGTAGTLALTGNISSTNAITGVNFQPISNTVTSTFTIGGNNTYNGTTTLGYASINIGSATAFSSGNIITGNNPALNNTSGSPLTIANNITGNSTFSYAGVGAAQALTFSGTVTLSGANVTVSNAGTLTFSGAVDASSGNRTLSVNNAAGTLTLGGVVNWGARQAQKSGAGTLVLSNANTGAGVSIATGGVNYTSTLRINAGTVSVGNPAAFGTGVVDIRGATLQSTVSLSGATKLTNPFVIATGSPVIGGASPLELGGAFILNNAANNQTLTINNTSATKLSGTVSLTDLTADAQTLTVSVASTAGPAEISGVIQNTTTGTAVGSFTKTGAGLLTLSNTSTYTGATQITGGALQLGGTGSINATSGITINGSGAKLIQTSSVASTPAITLTSGAVDGTGTAGAVTVASNSANTIATGNGTGAALTLGALTFSGLGATNFALAGGASTAAPLVVTGALTTSGGAASVSLNATALTPLVSGTTYKLISYGSFSGNLGDFTKGSFAGLSARQVTFANDTVNKVITVAFSGAPDSPKWTGLDDGTWQAGLSGTNKNWKLVAAAAATDFIQGDDVLFDDSATGTTAVVVTAANVSPATTVFNNSTLAYSLSSPGTFGIAGTGTLVKTGSAALSLNNPNIYSGGTNLNAGTLNLNHAAAIGTGPLTITGGTLDNTSVDLALLPAPITLSTNNLQNWNGDFGFGGTTDLNLGTGAVTLGGNRTVTTAGSAFLTVGGVIGGNFSLTTAGTGSGTLRLTGFSTYTGGTVVNSGTLTLANGGANGVVRGALTINPGAVVNLASNNSLGYNTNGTQTTIVTVNGGTLLNNGGQEGYATNFILTGGTMGGTNPTGFQFSSNAPGITTLASSATSVISNLLNYQGSGTFGFNVAAGTAPGGIDLNVSGNITGGTGAIITKTGAGLMQFVGAKTYTGVTTVSGGTLQLGDGTTSGSLAGTSIVDNATLVFNNVGTQTYAGVISGTGAVINAGSGAQTLSGTNTYTGATTVTGGTLALTGSNATTSVAINGPGAKLLSAVSLNAPIALTQGTFDGTGSVPAVTVGAGSGGVLANGNGVAGTLSVSGTLTFNGAGTLALIPLGGAANTTAPLVTNTLVTSGTPGAITVNVAPASPLLNGTSYNLIGFTSFAGTAAEFVKGAGFTARQNVAFAKTANFITLSVNGDNPVWCGASGGVWTTSTTGVHTGTPDWASKVTTAPTNFWASDNVEFNDTVNLNGITSAPTTTTVTIRGGDVSPTSMTFNNSALPYTVLSDDGSVIAAGNLIKTGTNKVTLLTANTYTGPTTINAGTLQLGNDDFTVDGDIGASSAIQNNGSLVFNRNESFSYGGVISGTGAVTLAGYGTQTLGGLNTFSGGVHLNGGILRAGSATALGAATNALSFGAAGGGRLRMNGNSVTVSSLNGDDTAAIDNSGAANAILTVNNGVNCTFGGTIQNGATGNIALTKTGAGNLTITGISSFTGATTVNAGTLAISGTGSLGATAVSVTGGTLRLESPGAITQNTVAISGAGSLVETADNALSGSASLNVGNSLTLARANSYNGQTTLTAPNLTLTLNDPAAAGTGRLFSEQDNTTYEFHMNGGGTLAMPNSFTQDRVGTTTMDVNNNGDASTTGVVQLNGAFTIGDTGTETLNVTGDNGYSLYLANVRYGNWHVATVAFNPTTAALKIGTYTGGISQASTLVLEGTHTGSGITGAITEGSGFPVTLTKSDTGTWTLTGANAYTGTTTISGGSLQIGDGGTTGTLGASAVVNNATLAFNRSDVVTVPNVISGGGSVSMQGTGTVTLAGANTYAGETVVNAGVLTIPTAFLSNTAAVRLGAAGTLNLTSGTTDVVDSFYLNGVLQVAGTWGSLTSTATCKTARITGTGILSVTNGAVITSAYANWATAKGLVAGVNDGPNQDPDHDGIANALEFVLGGNPLAVDQAILPRPSVDDTYFYFTFNRADESEAEIALTFEYGTDLVGWTPVTIGAVSELPVVAVVEGTGATPDVVTIAIPRSNAVKGKLLGRLKATK